MDEKVVWFKDLHFAFDELNKHLGIFYSIDNLLFYHCNPPYSLKEIIKFVKKAHITKENGSTIFLIPLDICKYSKNDDDYFDLEDYCDIFIKIPPIPFVQKRGENNAQILCENNLQKTLQIAIVLQSNLKITTNCLKSFQFNIFNRKHKFKQQILLKLFF